MILAVISCYGTLAAVGVLAGLAAFGSACVLYALFVDYTVATELTGFVLLVGAAVRDLYLRRREEATRLGPQSPNHT